ncbi:MAG: regulatory protein RecX [Spirochaetia bacterium]
MVHAESSSSQSVNPHITALKEGASGEYVQVLLSDSSSFFVPPYTLVELRLRIDLEVGDALFGQLRAADELLSAKYKVAELLTRREHSRFELSNKLKKRQYSKEVISKALDAFQESKLLDDRRFAEIWIRNRLRRKSEGPTKLKAALKQKGVADEVIEEVLPREYGAEARQQALEQATEKSIKKSQGDRDKFIRMLLYRGFSWKQINNYSISKFFQYYDELR